MLEGFCRKLGDRRLLMIGTVGRLLKIEPIHGEQNRDGFPAVHVTCVGVMYPDEVERFFDDRPLRPMTEVWHKNGELRPYIESHVPDYLLFRPVPEGMVLMEATFADGPEFGVQVIKRQEWRELPAGTRIAHCVWKEMEEARGAETPAMRVLLEEGGSVEAQHVILARAPDQNNKIRRIRCTNRGGVIVREVVGETP